MQFLEYCTENKSRIAYRFKVESLVSAGGRAALWELPASFPSLSFVRQGLKKARPTWRT